MRTLARWAVIALASLAIAACGSDSQTAASSSSTTPPTAATAPRVWSWPASDNPTDTTGMAAIVAGTLHYDAEHDCFQLEKDGGGVRYAVVWPVGTQAAAEGIGVRLANGRTLRDGDSVSGGGGFTDVRERWDIPSGCTAPDGDVAVFNAGDQLSG